jgi:hypothetical protein
MKSRKTTRMAPNAVEALSMRDENPTPLEIGKANMIFDSSRSLPLSGIRGMDRDRHLLFTAPDLDIHVKITEADRQKEIYGQVIPHATTEEFTIMLVTGKEAKEVRRPDRFGEFSFDEVPAGQAAIEIILPSRRVVATFDV